MLTLDTLPLPILLHIIDFFPNVEFSEQDQRTVTIRSEVEMEVKMMAKEVSALASCNRALRRRLLPITSATFPIGSLGKYKGVLTQFEKLASLASKGDEMLACVRNLLVASLTPRGVEVACACIAKMPQLENVSWLAQHPVPPAIAEALSKAPSFTTLVLHDFGVDSLPSLLPLASKIKRFHLSTERKALNVKEIVKLCPDLPGLKRRSKMPWNQRNVATLEEQREVFFRHLPTFLRQACVNIEELCIEGAGIVEGDQPFPWLQKLFDAMIDDNRQYPAFPQLSGLWLRNCDAKSLAFRHLIKKSAQSLRFLEIHTLEHGALQAPRRPLPLLQEFCYFQQDNVSCVDMVNSITQHSLLQILYLNGARPTDIRKIFGPLFRCGDSLRQLQFQGAPWNIFMELSHVQVLVAACPNLIALDIKGSWEMEAENLLAALEPLKKLRRFAFDHPWEKPRDHPFPSPDGRTIRSVRNGDFRIISVMGTSVEEEMGHRIREDIDAVRPTYQQRFKNFAEQMPELNCVRWSCTEAVVWTWTFERHFDPDGQERIICHDEPFIPYGKTITGPKVERGGIYMTAPRGM